VLTVPRPILQCGNILDVLTPYKLGNLGLFHILRGLEDRGDRAESDRVDLRCSDRDILTEVIEPDQAEVF
jgi:hypothetical protein